MNWKSVAEWIGPWGVAVGVLGSLATIGAIQWGFLQRRFIRSFRRLRAGNRSLLAQNKKLQQLVLDLELKNEGLKSELAKLQADEPGYVVAPQLHPGELGGWSQGAF